MPIINEFSYIRIFKLTAETLPQLHDYATKLGTMSEKSKYTYIYFYLFYHPRYSQKHFVNILEKKIKLFYT